jgi:hypothetical protein
MANEISIHRQQAGTLNVGESQKDVGLDTGGSKRKTVPRWPPTLQRVRNLRLSLGHAMQGGELRDIEWVPPKNFQRPCHLHKTPPRRMARGSGRQMQEEGETA